MASKDSPVPRITQGPEEVFSLAEALHAWGVESCFNFPLNVAKEWLCSLVPYARSKEDLLREIVAGRPVFASEDHAKEVVDTVGADGLAFVTDKKWNHFPKKKIAFMGGWSQPGTVMTDEKYFHLVSSFGQVVQSDEPLNLQMFHRQGPDQPKLPVLAEKLKWPLTDLIDGPKGDMGVVVDNATRVSKKGALTWWHLDDGGEFVFQVALPLTAEPQLIGPNGRPVVKLFVFTPRGFYDMIAQDEDTIVTETVAGLHLFDTPSHHLPYVGKDGKTVLPRLLIAPLEAGGCPLLSPPNVPHLVLTVQDCVMIEQRKISRLFLDEVHYFLERCKRWVDAPVMYNYLTTEIKDPKLMYSANAVPMMVLLQTSLKKMEAAETSDFDKRLYSAIASRALTSLTTMSSFTKEFALGADVQEKVRASVRDAKRAVSVDERAVEYQALLSHLKLVNPGVTHFPDGRYAAWVVIAGRPRWGPVRQWLGEAHDDRRYMEDTAEADAPRLEEQLLALHRGDSTDFKTAQKPAAAPAASMNVDDFFD